MGETLTSIGTCTRCVWLPAELPASMRRAIVRGMVSWSSSVQISCASRGESSSCVTVRTSPVTSGYSNTDLASLYLLSDGEYSLHSLAVHNNNHSWHLYNHLESAIREGANQHQRALQITVDDPFQVASLRVFPPCVGLGKGPLGPGSLSSLGGHGLLEATELFPSRCQEY